MPRVLSVGPPHNACKHPRNHPLDDHSIDGVLTVTELADEAVAMHTGVEHHAASAPQQHTCRDIGQNTAYEMQVHPGPFLINCNCY